MQKIIYEGQQIFVAPCFIYEVDIYHCEPNMFWLLNTRYYKSNKFHKVKTTRIKHNGYHTERIVSLIAAPLEFIKENKLIKNEKTY